MSTITITNEHTYNQLIALGTIDKRFLEINDEVKGSQKPTLLWVGGKVVYIANDLSSAEKYQHLLEQKDLAKKGLNSEFSGIY